MATYLSGHQKIFWDLLLTTGLWGTTGRITPSEHTITIVSPWITDVSSEGSGWPEELSMQACQTRNTLNSLRLILIALMEMGFKVRIVTMDRHGKWLDKKEKKMLKNEMDFFKKMHDNGAICERRRDMHFKWLCTPVGLWKGSSNSSANGLFGRLEEQNDLFFIISEEDNYHYQKELMEFAIQYSTPYFDRINDISTMIFDPNITANSNLNLTNLPISETGIQPHVQLADGDYPDYIPPNYISVGNINPGMDGYLNQQQLGSIKTWISQTIERLISFVDFIFVEGGSLLEIEDNNTWLDHIRILTLNHDTITLSQSDQVSIEGSLEVLTSHEILFRIKNKLHIMQCFGISLDQNNNLIQSDWKDASGLDLNPFFYDVLMKYIPVNPETNQMRVENLSSLVFTFVNIICHIDNLEQIPHSITNRLSDCILEIESRYLREIEDYY